MRRPIRTVVIHHSVTKASRNPAADFRQLDRIGKARFGRFSYSYAVHPSGVAGEGAGLTVGTHTAGRNSTAIGICLIGNFQKDTPTPAALDATADIIGFLQAAGVLTADVAIIGHRDTKGTACPGSNLYAALPALRQRVKARSVTAPPRPPLTAPPPDLVAVRDAVAAASKHTLRPGSRGDAVRVLQMLLNNKLGGPDITVDGTYGPGTGAAVRQFQTNVRRFFNLTPAQMPSDGVVGPLTWFWLTR
jgi:N-acetylmuramoyl-L-alanine amidase